MIDIYDINLLTETTMPPIIRCSQGDNGIRQVKFNLYNGSSVYTPSNLSAMVYGLRPDGASWGPEYCTISGSTVLFTLTEKMTMIGGRSSGELAFMDKNGNKVSTTNFTLMVETTPLPGVYEESKCDFSGVVSQKLTEAMQKLEKEIAARKASDEELKQKLLDGGFYTDTDLTNKYNQGYSAGNSAGYTNGVSAADARVNTNSASYKSGYEAGLTAGKASGVQVGKTYKGTTSVLFLRGWTSYGGVQDAQVHSSNGNFTFTVTQNGNKISITPGNVDSSDTSSAPTYQFYLS